MDCFGTGGPSKRKLLSLETDKNTNNASVDNQYLKTELPSPKAGSKLNNCNFSPSCDIPGYKKGKKTQGSSSVTLNRKYIRDLSRQLVKPLNKGNSSAHKIEQYLEDIAE